jgi:hypothetical protein
MLTSSLGVTAGDPVVALITWALTYAVGRWCPARFKVQVRAILPAIAVLLAVAISAGAAQAQHQPLTIDVVLRGVGAAGAAVLGHSQLRELLKRLETSNDKQSQA